jgi:proteasome assembly chaperone (PAC2) family protein
MAIDDNPATWLLAAWPGMGSVALVAASHLVGQFDGTLEEELPSSRWFPVNAVDVEHGLARTGKVPRSLLFRCSGALPDGTDLLVFIGEDQPSREGYDLCLHLVDRAKALGVRRCITCAAMATQMQPGADPRVFAAATRQRILAQATMHGAEALEDGQISGLNGLLLAAAAQRQCDGLCLMGEMPYFATALPNPHASLAALRVFGNLTGIPLELQGLEEQAQAVDDRLVEVVQQLETRNTAAPETPRPQPASGAPAAPKLDQGDHHQIERLFEAARNDRSKAFELKQELDRRGVFGDYEDRFLDLFRKTE